MRTRFASWALLVFFAGCLSGAAQADDSALFWALNKDGEHAGILLGTIHSDDPRVLD